MIELLVVLTVAGILIAVGLPYMNDFVADQRVRTAASDLMADISFSRANAIETSRRVYMQKTGAAWSNGWLIFADLNDNQSYDAGEELKRFDGYPAGSNMYLCSPVADFVTNVIFRPDGRIVRTSAQSATDGFYVVYVKGDNNIAHNKIRGVQFGLSGRPTVVLMNGQAAPC